ncbi:hypothetical protein QBC39DRAFT_347133 [Podospora conica]|nr:hypothetical protein QBC39DRAFT_347133 [Schizothecium conicum]
MVSSISTAFLVLAAAVAPSHAAMAAWWTGIGPQIILQNTTTGAIRHSPCNAFGVPTYSHTDSRVLPLSQDAKMGTALAGAGWWNEKTTTASIFYTTKSNQIINALFECDMETGLFNNKGSWVASQENFPVHNDTDLAVLLLGDADGYRVYYHDDQQRVNEIGYTQETDWHHRKILTPDSQGWPAIGAFRANTPANISVVSAHDTQNVMVARNAADEAWYLSSFPRPLSGNFSTSEADPTSVSLNQTALTNFTMPAWDGKPGALGLTIDSAYTRFVWYVGTDKALHQIQSKSFVWSVKESQASDIWPAADSANAELAIAADQRSSMVRIYYFVDGRLTELKYENNSWKPFKALAEPKPITTGTDTGGLIPSSSSTASPTDTAAAAVAATGLSTGAKAGIAVGVVLGVVGLVAVGIILFLARRKKQAAAAADSEPPSAVLGPAEVAAPPYGSRPPTGSPGYEQYMWEKKQYPLPTHAVHQLDSVHRPMEMEAAPRPMYELPSQAISHELVGDARTMRHQAP